MLELVRNTNPADKLMYVVDTRPKVSRATSAQYSGQHLYCAGSVSSRLAALRTTAG